MSNSALVDIRLLDSPALTSTSTYLSGQYSGVTLRGVRIDLGTQTKSVDGQLGAEENEFHPERAQRSLSGVGVFRIQSFMAAGGEGRWRRRRHNGGRVRNIDVHDHTLLGVARRRSIHWWCDRAIEGRMTGLAAISAQIVEATTFPFSLCQTISSTRVDFHRNRPICRMCRKVQLGSGVRVRRGLGGCRLRSVGRSGAVLR